MKLLLTSAGITNNSLEKALKKLVGGEIKIAFIPTAANVEEGDKSWLIEDINKCKKLGSVEVADISILDKKDWFPILKRANVIFVGGGNTTYLLNEVKKSGLDRELKNLLSERVYVGISAGSMILSKTIQTSLEYLFRLYDDESENPPLGLGFIDFDIRPHLNSSHFEKVTEKNLDKLFKNFSNTLYVLDDDSAVLVDDSKIEVISEGKWIKYPKF